MLAYTYPLLSIFWTMLSCGSVPDDLLHHLVLYRQLPTTRSSRFAKAG